MGSGRGNAGRGARRRIAWGAAAVALCLAPAAAPAAEDAALLGAEATTLSREPLVLPALLGEDPLEELQFGDPKEGLDLIEAPQPSNSGDAELELPLTLPDGRGGVQPDLTLTYSSSGANGWLGLGWDLDVGSIEVDRRWGVPRFLPDEESESYTLDGAQLGPNAVRADFAEREGDRLEFTRRVEDQHERVIRHGTGPKTYFWEVHEKSGAVRYYGARPDTGGPVNEKTEIDEDAVLRDDHGNIVRWALTAQRDAYVNVTEYSYERVAGQRVGRDRLQQGRQLYLSRIRYTGALSDSGEAYDPAYEVRILRGGVVDGEPRQDVVVDGTGGFLEVTSDLVRRIEVWTGAPRTACPPGAGTVEPPCVRAYDTFARGFDLHYRQGAFGKTLLRRVDQLDANRQAWAGNELDYFDDVRDGGGYDAFGPEQEWNPGSDGLSANLLESFGVSALGSSETNAGDGHLYVGIGALPGKTAGAGASLTVNGGASEGLTELLDINGDGLPDKVWREGRGRVKFRENRARPGGGTTFGPVQDVQGIGGLSKEWNIGFGAAAEGYLGGFASFNVGGEVSVGEDYWTDANADGLPDLVSGGRVLFNHPEDPDGDGPLQEAPSFSSSSTGTPVPIGTRDPTIPPIPAIDQLEEDQRASSPLHDTVRRWVAPYGGRVRIEGAAVLDPPPDLRPNAPASYEGDGVRLAIQRSGAELWSARLETPGQSVTPTQVADLRIEKGQALYFRVQSVDHGVGDEVRWDPKVTYESFDGEWGTGSIDADGRHVGQFRASEDFSVFGLPRQRIPLPLQGTARFEGRLRVLRPVTDDVTLVVQKNGGDVLRHTVPAGDVAPDGLNFGVDIPSTEATGEAVDLLTVHLEVDTPIDASAIQWHPRVFYKQATVDGQEVPTEDADGRKLLELKTPPTMDVFRAVRAPDAPYGFETGADGAVFIVRLRTTGTPPGSKGLVSFRQRSGVKEKVPFTITSSDPDHQTRIEVDTDNATSFEDAWIDVVFEDQLAAATVVDSYVTDPFTDANPHLPGPPRRFPHTVWSPGATDYVSFPHRGWGQVAYDQGGRAPTDPLVESVFGSEDPGDVPDQNPDDFASNEVMAEPTASPFFPYQLPRYAADGTQTGTLDAWRGSKDNIFVAAGIASSSRRGSDDPAAVEQPALAIGAGASAPKKIGVGAPSFGVSLGAFGANASFGAGQSFGLLEYEDMNGDGFPDIVSPSSIEYTGPRGGYRDDDCDLDISDTCGLDVVNRDVTFSVGAGFGGSGVDVGNDAQGESGTPQNTDASSGGGQSGAGGGGGTDGDSSQADFGFNLGGSIGLQASFTNPGLPDPDWDDGIEEIGDDLPQPEEHDLADVNGDGLPDRVRVDTAGVHVKLNTGYAFRPEIKWAEGGFEASQSLSGDMGLSVGFNFNNFEFGGGLAYNEGIDLSRYAWVDVNGDGILDRLRKDGADDVKVAFGTSAGVLDEVDFGHFAPGAADVLPGVDDRDEIPLGQMIAQGRSRGLGGGLDFSFSYPLCVFSCWLTVNPGVHYNRSIANSVVQLQDVDGDGFADSVSSNADHELDVRLNRTGRTNLLRSVKNPLGGELRLDYARSGNTRRQPGSQWVLSRLELDDNRPGDGPDVQVRTFEYDGGQYDPLERDFLGYRTVTERQRDSAADGEPVVRSIQRSYRQGTVFETGLLESEKLLDADGDPVRETRTAWGLFDLETGAERDVEALNGPERLGLALSPRRTSVTEVVYDAAGAEGQRTQHTFEYDDLGNVVRQVDRGEIDDPADDLVATTTYPTCETGWTLTDADDGGIPCPDPAAPEPANASPLWDAEVCPSWVSIPAHFEVRDAAGKLLRERDGAPALCDNSVVTELRERTDAADPAAVAETTLGFDAWGSYASITYPEGADGRRQSAEYVFDGHAHTSVGRTTDAHGLVGKATYDPRTGRIASREDANGNVTTYAYDAQGRIKEVVGPYEQGTGRKSVTYEYRLDAPYAMAFARHFDAERPDDPIETAAFVDGLGRRTQTKQDATVFRGVGQAAQDVMSVSGAIEYDAVGREVKEWHPIEEPLGTAHVYNTNVNPTRPTTTTYDAADRTTKIVHPDLTETRHVYGFDQVAGAGPRLTSVLTTDAAGKRQRRFLDMRGDERAVEELGATQVRRTVFRRDALGQLTEVVEPGGGTTRHTYDLLGRRTSTDSPDHGLVQRRYDAASNQVAEITPNQRAAGTQTTLRYDVERLVQIDHPAGTADVAKTYGGPGAAGQGAGRVVRVDHGTRRQELTYEPFGEIASERLTRYGTTAGDDARVLTRHTTAFTYDGLGRLQQLTYPDGEVLSHEHDRGGLLSGLRSTQGSRSTTYVDRLEYDQFGDRRFQLLGNGARTVLSYDVLRRLARQVTDGTRRGEVQDLNLTYDGVGNVRRLDNQLPQNPTVEPSRHDYVYDDFHRLQSASATIGTTPKLRGYTFSTAYDLAGNVVDKRQVDTSYDSDWPDDPSEPPVPVGPTTYSQTAVFEPGTHRATRIGNRRLSYDANGNLTGWYDPGTQHRLTLNWDAADRMSQLRFDGRNARLQRFSYDAEGDLAGQEGQGYPHFKVNQWFTVPTADDDSLVKHVFADGRQVASAAVRGLNRTWSYLNEDAQGSVDVVTDHRGEVVETTEYFPSGEVWVQRHPLGGARPVVQGFAGGVLDPGRSLTNLGARWYDPRDAMFLSPDPLLRSEPDAVVEDPALLPAYTYAESNPLRLVDTDGRSPKSIMAAFGAVIGQGLRPQQPAAAAPVRFGLNDHLQTLLRRAHQAAAGQGTPGLTPALAPKERGRFSRMKSALGRKPDDNPMKDISKALGARPLVKIKLSFGPDGVKLDGVRPLGFEKLDLVRKPSAGANGPAAAASDGPGPPSTPSATSGSGSATPASPPKAASNPGPAAAGP